LKQIHGSNESVHYLHSTTRPSLDTEETLEADFCFIPVKHS